MKCWKFSLNTWYNEFKLTFYKYNDGEILDQTSKNTFNFDKSCVNLLSLPSLDFFLLKMYPIQWYFEEPFPEYISNVWVSVLATSCMLQFQFVWSDLVTAGVISLHSPHSDAQPWQGSHVLSQIVSINLIDKY